MSILTYEIFVTMLCETQVYQYTYKDVIPRNISNTRTTYNTIAVPHKRYKKT